MIFKHSYFYAVFWQNLKQNRLAMAGGFVVGLLFVVSVLAPLLVPYDPNGVNAWQVLSPPSWQHWFGTDELGRDVLSRVIYGARISLKVGFVAIGIAVAIGTMVGLVSGYYSGIVDTALMRFVDIMLCFPAFFLILAVIAIREPSIWNIMIVIGLTGWMGVAGAILTESALSFLGIGVLPPTPSWGNILTSGKDYIEFAWWLSLFPGLAILVTVLAYNLLGEGIRDALDPRVKR